MEKIKWKNGQEGGTPIPIPIFCVFEQMYNKGYIGNIQLNAKNLNKIHPEVLFPKLNWNPEKIAQAIKRILEEK